jgi:hypothetical protein
MCELRVSAERSRFLEFSSGLLPASKMENLPKSEAGLRASETPQTF